MEQLHSNFCEVKYTEADVRRGLANANPLLSTLKAAEERVQSGDANIGWGGKTPIGKIACNLE